MFSSSSWCRTRTLIWFFMFLCEFTKICACTWTYPNLCIHQAFACFGWMDSPLLLEEQRHIFDVPSPWLDSFENHCRSSSRWNWCILSYELKDVTCKWEFAPLLDDKGKLTSGNEYSIDGTGRESKSIYKIWIILTDPCVCWSRRPCCQKNLLFLKCWWCGCLR